MVPHNLEATPGFKCQAETHTSIAAFIAQDWARITQPFSTECMTSPAYDAPMYFPGTETKHPYIAHPRPRANIHNDLAQLVANYSVVVDA